MLKPLYDSKSKGRPMRVACFMSSTGTNVGKILEYQRNFERIVETPPFKVVAIFTDNPDSNAKSIAEEFNIPYIENDFEKLFEGKDKNDWEFRKLFDRMTYWLIKSYNIHTIALCGYSRIVTRPLIDNYLIVNVHPGDLSVVEDGKRKYVGLHHIPVKKAIDSGEKFLHSTTHIVTENLDSGSILLISKGLKIELPGGMSIDELRSNDVMLNESSKEHQNKLKEIGDWQILPLTLHWIAEGKFVIDDSNRIYLDGNMATSGFRL